MNESKQIKMLFYWKPCKDVCRLFDNSISNLFFVSIGEKILAGITILSSLIAIIKTYGLTTQSIIFLILLIPIFIKKKSTEKIQPITKKTMCH